jgi:hypothetical protein
MSMKRISEKTKLVQGNNVYDGHKIDDVIYWLYDTEVLHNEWFINPRPGYVPKRFKKRSEWDGVSLKCLKVVAQSKQVLTKVPVIDMATYPGELFENGYGVPLSTNAKIRKEGFIDGYNSNENCYTLEDLKSVIFLTQMHSKKGAEFNDTNVHNIINMVDVISGIFVNESFEIIGYK